MKKQLLLFIILTIFTLNSSCSDEPKNCDIIGKWKLVSIISNKPVDVNNDGVYTKNLIKEDPCINLIFYFKDSKNGKRSEKSSKTGCKYNNTDFTYKLTKNKFIIFKWKKYRFKYRYYLENCYLSYYEHKRLKTNFGIKNIEIEYKFKKL